MTLVVSGTKYVTTHLCSDEIFKIFNHIRKMKNSEDNNISDMAGSMLQKLGKYWDEQNGNNAKLNKLGYIASVFDPRHKLHLRNMFSRSFMDQHVLRLCIVS
ncbi:hypothetical protein LINPERHAP1_LOCUS25070 [Linum perenne]